MGGIVRSQDGTCTVEDCERPVEYVGVLMFGSTTYSDLCRQHFLDEASVNADIEWYEGHPAEEGTPCGFLPSCDDQAEAVVRQAIDDTDIPVCLVHLNVVMLFNVLLSTGWGGHRVEPGSIPARVDEEPVGQVGQLPW